MEPLQRRNRESEAFHRHSGSNRIYSPPQQLRRLRRICFPPIQGEEGRARLFIFLSNNPAPAVSCSTAVIAGPVRYISLLRVSLSPQRVNDSTMSIISILKMERTKDVLFKPRSINFLSPFHEILQSSDNLEGSQQSGCSADQDFAPQILS